MNSANSELEQRMAGDRRVLLAMIALADASCDVLSAINLAQPWVGVLRTLEQVRAGAGAGVAEAAARLLAKIHTQNNSVAFVGGEGGEVNAQAGVGWYVE